MGAVIEFLESRAELIDSYLGGKRWRLNSWFIEDSFSSRQEGMLRMLAFALNNRQVYRERDFLNELLISYAQAESGIYGSQVNRLARHLRAGIPLVDALEQTPGLVSKESMLYLRCADNAGRLPAAIELLCSRMSTETRSSKLDLYQSLIYFAVIGSIIAVLMVFLSVFIVPTFRQMFEEFGLRENTFLQNYDRFVEAFALLALISLLLVSIGRSVWRWLGSNSTMRRLLDQQSARFGGQLRRAQIARCLADGLNAGRPITSEISSLAKFHFHPSTRADLLFVRNELEHGRDVWNCLAEVGVFKHSDCRLLKNAASSKEQAWLLNCMATQLELRAEHRSKFWVSCVHPALALLLGFVVLWSWGMIFGTLLTLVTSLA
ncbi:MAG: type II secretion system F family protein [Planctomycetales bacterium]|nr:type II secretion system F family protein [Planctomycetales bacterium]